MMNPFLNPITGVPFLKNFLFDARRLRTKTPEYINRYRDGALRKTLRYASSVPLYQQRYHAAGAQLSRISGINEIAHVPFISKQDIVQQYPLGLLPSTYNKNNVRVVSTAGSTGKQVSIYTDFSVYAGGIGATLRIFDYLQLPWRTSRLANIGNFNPSMADSTAEHLLYSQASFVYNNKRRLMLNAFSPIHEILTRLDQFRPDVIYSYPATFFHLAFYKRKGYGEHIAPKALLVSGSVLEPYTRSYVEEAFGCKMYNGYGSVESSSEAPIAFECCEGTWHINYDFFHVEAINEAMDLVEEGHYGHIVVTRLFGKATPIVRYTGLDDWVVISEEHCPCGLHTPILKGGVEGRRSDSVILPDGRLFPAASFASLYAILNEMKTRKVKQFQIVQKTLTEIDILVIIDEDLRTVGPSVEVIFEKIREIHQKKAGPGVEIHVKEVNDIRSLKGKPAPLVVSHVRPEKGYKVVDV